MAGNLDREFVTIYFMQGSPEKHKLAVRRVYLVLGLIGFVFVAVFLRVWQEMRITSLGYQITQARAESRKLADEQRLLLSQRNALAKLERVEALAANTMGLRPPQADQLIFLPDPGAARPRRPEWLAPWVQAVARLEAWARQRE